MEKAQKAAAAALAAAKKPRIPNPLHSGNASGVRGSTTAAISKPLVSMEKNMLLTASAPAAAVMKPSSAGIGKTQAGVPSSAGGSALVVGNGGGARSTTAAETINSYEMSDHDGSSSSSDSENEEAHKRKKKKQVWKTLCVQSNEHLASLCKVGVSVVSYSFNYRNVICSLLFFTCDPARWNADSGLGEGVCFVGCAEEAVLSRGSGGPRCHIRSGLQLRPGGNFPGESALFWFHMLNI